jgi:hypothetical protein
MVEEVEMGERKKAEKMRGCTCDGLNPRPLRILPSLAYLSEVLRTQSIITLRVQPHRLCTLYLTLASNQLFNHLNSKQ